MKIRSIIAGIDLGQDTDRVLACATLFAKATGSSLDLLHVLDYLVTPPAYLTAYMEEEKNIAERKMRPWEEKLEAEGIKTVREIVIGRLHESFDAAIRKTGADMLVLGFRSHMLRWSSSERLIKGLKIPMLVVRGEKMDTAKIGTVRIRRILCPTDLSESSARTLVAARELQKLFSAELDIIHVVPTHAIRETLAGDRDKDRAGDDIIRHARDGFATFLRSAGVEQEGTLLEGEPYRKILHTASEKSTDLIVMGARGLSYLEGMIIGSVTDAVLKSSPCPVLVIH